MEGSKHNVEQLLARWDAFAEARGWSKHLLGRAGDFPVEVYLNPLAAETQPGGLYVSAGVHGDECAPPWALLEWAESRPSVMDREPVVVVPCFNPEGLVENTRCNGEGVDLNRVFQDPHVPLIGAWHSFLKSRRFSIALNLHEDYDATGIYLYQIADEGSPGDGFLRACEDIIPRETAAMVDGSEFENGLFARPVLRADIEQMVREDLDGMPEAIYLYLHHTQNSFTFETPSELDVGLRIAAHRRFLEAATAHLLDAP